MAMPGLGKGPSITRRYTGQQGTPGTIPTGNSRRSFSELWTILERLCRPFAEKLTDGEIEAVLEYIKSNWESKQRELQEEVSRNWLELNDSKRSQ